MLKYDYENLNEQQRDIVFESNGNVLVVAGPGSGKTHTLVSRASYLINEKNVNEDNIIILTFTKKAANEIVKRIRNLTNKNVYAGTFHSFCYNKITKDKDIFENLLEYTIIDEDEAFDAFKFCVDEKTSKQLAAKALGIDVIFWLYDMSRHFRKSIKDTIKYFSFISDENEIDEITDIICKITEKYKNLKNKNKRLDYNDLLEKFLEALVYNDNYKKRLTENLYLFVDEYQDTNRIQFDIVKELAYYNNQVMAFGDDCQSIYKFRGANYENMVYFVKELKDVTVKYLTINYRSGVDIIDYYNDFMKNMIEIFYKDKRIIPHRTEKGFVKNFVFENYYEQANFVVNELKRILVEDGNTKFSDIAILYRRNSDSYVLETLVSQNGIPYVKYGGKKFLEQAHLKDIISMLNLIINPDDEFSLSRILSKVRGIGEVKLNKILEEKESGNFKIYDYNTFDSKMLGTHAYIELKKYAGFISKYKENYQEYSARFIVTEAINVMNEMLQRNYGKDYYKRRYSIDTFREISKFYSNIKVFLDKIRLDDTYEEENEKDKLVLSTIHSIKGLEFKYVFVISVFDGILPAVKFPASQYAEEQRLFYVAITRAKDGLYVTTYKDRDTGELKSVFLDIMLKEGYTLLDGYQFIYENNYSDHRHIVDKYY
ncbi:MAG: ATP-dependent helicase [Candidatus Bilamarchaeaceae archaeon]